MHFEVAVILCYHEGKRTEVERVLFPHPFGERRPLPTEDRRLTSSFSSQDLPASYLQLLASQNGGYVRKMIVPTEEPTSDGLDHANLHYLFGLHADPDYSLLYQQERLRQANIPEYFLIFSANGSQLFAFDYSRLDPEGEPAIRYLDLETDNWQTVAPDFTSFLQQLKPGKITIPLEGSLTRYEAEHAFLLAETVEELTELFLHLEVDAEKEWYLHWLGYFSGHAQPAVQAAGLEALETQILYFRLQLPPNTQAVLNQFQQSENPELREQAQKLWEEWRKAGW